MKGIGLIGCGEIGDRYIRDLSRFHPVIACASHSPESAGRLAAAHGIAGLDEAALLARRDIDLVLNLTPPLAHAAVTGRALGAGKNVYSEKPLAPTLAQADALLESRGAGGAALACARATHLGPALQTARALIDDGELGEIVGATASIVYGGPDLWHPSPVALFGPAAGPLFDMGVYAVNAFVSLLGPVTRVAGLGRTMRATRSAATGPSAGVAFPVSSPTHVTALLTFESGAVASLLASFDSPGSRSPGLELMGTRASLAGPGCSLFDGPLRVCRRLGEWRDQPSLYPDWSDALWPIGVLDMIQAIEEGRAPRCSGALARHVLEVLTAIEASVRADGASLTVTSRCERPARLEPDAYRRFRETMAT